MTVKVDKGFLIDNECALHGVNTIRPTKKISNQTQQRAEHTLRATLKNR